MPRRRRDSDEDLLAMLFGAAPFLGDLVGDDEGDVEADDHPGQDEVLGEYSDREDEQDW